MDKFFDLAERIFTALGKDFECTSEDLCYESECSNEGGTVIMVDDDIGLRRTVTFEKKTGTKKAKKNDARVLVSNVIGPPTKEHKHGEWTWDHDLGGQFATIVAYASGVSLYQEYEKVPRRHKYASD